MVIILSDLSPSRKEKYHRGVFFLVCGSYILHRHINHICTYNMSIEATLSMGKGGLKVKVGMKRYKGKVVRYGGYAQSTLYIGYYLNKYIHVRNDDSREY